MKFSTRSNGLSYYGRPVFSSARPRYIRGGYSSGGRNVSVMKAMKSGFLIFNKSGGRGPRPIYYNQRPLRNQGGAPRTSYVGITYHKHNGDTAAMNSDNVHNLKYISRHSATIEEKPAYEDAMPGQELYTYTHTGMKKLMSFDEAAYMMRDQEVFRIILSPEVGGNVDLSLFAKKFMEDSFSGVNGLGRRPSCYVACNHYDTDHPHVHILVSRSPAPGVNDKEKLLGFPSSYISGHKAQNEAAAILTTMMGPLSRREYLENQQKLITAIGYSAFDRDIKNVQSRSYDSNGILSEFVITKFELDHVSPRRKKAVLARLSFLDADTDYVRRDLEGNYHLHPDWQKKLYAREKLDKMGLNAGNAVWDQKVNTPYKGTIKDIKIDNDFKEEVLFKIVDSDGKIHVIKDKVPMEYCSHMIGREVEVSGGGRKGNAQIKDKQNIYKDIDSTLSGGLG